MTPLEAWEARIREGQLQAWLTTLLVEAIVAALIARLFALKPSRAARAAVAGSLLTHPFVWWAYFQVIHTYDYWTTLVLIECIAVFGETPFYRLAGAPWHRALLISLIVNASSVLVGMLVL